MNDTPVEAETETLVCAECGKEDYSTRYVNCPERKIMRLKGVCFKCAFWLVRIRENNPRRAIINGMHHIPGNNPKGYCGFAGMGGRCFDIEYFDGRTVRTYDLWSQGRIPDHFRERLPDNARFLNGARQTEVGGTVCWDHSDDSAPLPSTEAKSTA